MRDKNDITLSSYAYKEVELSIITQHIQKKMIISLTRDNKKENTVISHSHQNPEQIRKVLQDTYRTIPHAYNEIINFIYSINKELFNILYSEFF